MTHGLDGSEIQPEVRIYWQEPDGGYRTSHPEDHELSRSDPAFIAWVLELAQYAGAAAAGGIIGNRSDVTVVRAFTRLVRGRPGDRYIAHLVARQAIEREYSEIIKGAPVAESVAEDGTRELQFVNDSKSTRYDVVLKSRRLGGDRATKVSRRDQQPDQG